MNAARAYGGFHVFVQLINIPAPTWFAAQAHAPGCFRALLSSNGLYMSVAASGKAGSTSWWPSRCAPTAGGGLGKPCQHL